MKRFNVVINQDLRFDRVYSDNGELVDVGCFYNVY